MALINVKIEDWQLLEMLLERCEAWGTSKDNIDLFEKMYQSYIDGYCFNGAEFNVMSIVDNDVVNYCSVIEKGEKDFKKLLKLYKKVNMMYHVKTLKNIELAILKLYQMMKQEF